MSLRRRVSRILAARRNAADPVDPLSALGETQRQQEDNLDRARRSVADLAAVRHRVDSLARQAAADLEACNREAERAVADNNDDSARLALRRALEVQKRLTVLTRQREDVEAQLHALEADLYRLETTLQENAVRYESIRAQHGATQAALDVQGAVSASTGSTVETARAAREAEQEARRLRHLQAAREELAWSDPTSGKLEGAFGELEARDAAERELQQLKDRTRERPSGQT